VGPKSETTKEKRVGAHSLTWSTSGGWCVGAPG